MSDDPVTVRRFRRADDLEEIARLWQEALAPTWPVLPAGLATLDEGYVAQRHGQTVGAVAIDPAGAITFVAVHPAHRRRGIGRRLVDRAVDTLRLAGHRAVRVGSGGDRYIWPGVPTDLPAAMAFFDALGWSEDHLATDLVQDLQSPGVRARLDAVRSVPGIDYQLAADAALAAAVLGFEDRHFPQWSPAFRSSGHDPLAALDDRGAIVGTLLVAGPGRVSRYWPLLGDDGATIRCVGVAPDREGAGIGTAMVAAASRLLAERGARNCHIDWVVRVSFYARLGYAPWRWFSVRRPREI